MVASHDRNFAQWPASLRANPRPERPKKGQPDEKYKKSQEKIVHLEEMLVERLDCYTRMNKGQLPKKIVFFRDGLSEAQFTSCKDEEIPQLRKAIAKVYKPENRPDVWRALPRIMVVCAVKRHHTRFYAPPGHKLLIPNKKGDAKHPVPGITVFEGVTNGKYDDFYMISQVTQLGTARPTHYVVLENEFLNDFNIIDVAQAVSTSLNPTSREESNGARIRLSTFLSCSAAAPHLSVSQLQLTLQTRLATERGATCVVYMSAMLQTTVHGIQSTTLSRSLCTKDCGIACGTFDTFIPVSSPLSASWSQQASGVTISHESLLFGYWERVRDGMEGARSSWAFVLIFQQSIDQPLRVNTVAAADRMAPALTSSHSLQDTSLAIFTQSLLLASSFNSPKSFIHLINTYYSSLPSFELLSSATFLLP